MNFDFQAGGSPLASRQNPAIYASVIIGIVIVLVFFLFWFIQKKVKQMRSTPEWIKKESERPTNKKDVIEFSEIQRAVMENLQKIQNPEHNLFNPPVFRYRRLF